MITPVVSVGGTKTSYSFKRSRQSGLTLVELMVALVISMLISLAAVSALVVSRQGFNTLDVTSQLRDNGRFVSDLVQRLGVQTGYKDIFYATREASPTEVAANVAPNIFGFNNSKPSASDPLNTATARSASEVGYGSDVLVLRYQSPETFPGSGVADGSMIDCMGRSITAIPTSRDDRMASIFHVAVGTDGEPSLMCTRQLAGGGFEAPQPLVQGVEDFQVLYGTDKVVANTAPTGSTDSVPDSYLRADQMTVAGDPVGTNNNWRRVRSIRVGMILRVAPGAQQQANTTADRLYPFGAGKNSSTGTAGSALSSAADLGTIFTPPIDGRLRQVVSFTVHLRNDQGL